MDSVDRQFYLQNKSANVGIVNSERKLIIDNNINALSNHPISPFKGSFYKWTSVKFSDGTMFFFLFSYEGLTLESVPHNKGTFIMGNLSAAGLKNTHYNDRFYIIIRYEGEIHGGLAHGLGVFMSSHSCVLYLGEFNLGRMQGCGISYNFTPFNRLIKKGFNYKKAWKLSKKKVMKNIKYGIFFDGTLVSSSKRSFSLNDSYVNKDKELVNSSSAYCNIYEIKGMLCELKNIITQTRMFQFKPGTIVYNDYAFRDFTLLNNQNPSDYPFNTSFLMPGPFGQLFSVPNDKSMKIQMLKTAKNTDYIHNLYNIKV
uniref:Morn repeat protein 1 n=1 Tax=Amorphochlora amoebiformis TaxID=1561963 RepID=A0A0H5BIU1_9EUKA|nr:Morn repeat protein 1 [Amorphochlora amoebiformis]